MSKTVERADTDRHAPDPPRLNLGCGSDHRAGYCNVDVSDDIDPDETVDLDEYPWPWSDGSVATIRAEHVLEHLREPVRAIEECCRVLEDGGTLTIVYPIGHTRFEDPTHRHFWNAKTALHLDRGGGKHDHEVAPPLTLADRDIDWSLAPDSRLRRGLVRAWLAMYGPGGWLSQVPGLYGEVEATYWRMSREGDG